MDTEKRLELLKATSAAADRLGGVRDAFEEMVHEAFPEGADNCEANRAAAMAGFEAAARAVFATAPAPDDRRVDTVLAREVAAAVAEIASEFGEDKTGGAPAPAKSKGGRPKNSTKNGPRTEEAGYPSDGLGSYSE